jgi:hypothetical protein
MTKMALMATAMDIPAYPHIGSMCSCTIGEALTNGIKSVTYQLQYKVLKTEQKNPDRIKETDLSVERSYKSTSGPKSLLSLSLSFFFVNDDDDADREEDKGTTVGLTAEV